MGAILLSSRLFWNLSKKVISLVKTQEMWWRPQAKKKKSIYPSIHPSVYLWLTALALEWEKDLFSPLRCLCDEDNDEEVEAGIVRVEGRVFRTVEVFPSWLRELHSLLLRGRPTSSSDSGDSRGGNSLSSRLRGCFFKELGRKNRKHVKGLCVCTSRLSADQCICGVYNIS